MYELHGWVVLRDSTSDSEWERLHDLAMSIAKRIGDSPQANPLVRLDLVNASYGITVYGLANHHGPDVEAIFDLYRLIAEIAPASYGLLYVRNDEDTAGLDNNFQAWVLKRGAFSRSSDPFLSPCIPQIEDP